MSEKWVLTEEEAVELLALMITSARTQMDEPTYYGPLRLLTATERLSAMILERASDKSREFLQDAIDRIPDMHMSYGRCRGLYRGAGASVSRRRRLSGPP